MKEKRSRISDRRQQPDAESELEIPLFDNEGNLIIEDRRVTPDRRLNSIYIEEVEWDDHVYDVIKRDKE